MNNTALGAESNKKENIRFISEAHEKFYYEKLMEVRYFRRDCRGSSMGRHGDLPAI